MARNIPPLNALRAFEATARHSSFSRAGEELSVVHTSVARHVRNLEDWLEVKLFHRSGRSIYLSDEGHRFFKEVEKIFEHIERATSDISPKPRLSVRLSIEPLFMHQWFAKRFYSKDWTDRVDGFDVEIQSSSQVSDLAKGEADLAIRHTVEPPSSAEAVLFSEQVIYPFVAPSVLASDTSRSKLDLLSQLQLHYAFRPGRWEMWFNEAGYKPKTPLKFMKQDDPRVALLATYSGSAGLLIGKELMQDDLSEGRVVQVSDVGLKYGHYVLLTSSNARLRPEIQRAKVFLQELLATFK